jgi:hypothetical protein
LIQREEDVAMFLTVLLWLVVTPAGAFAADATVLRATGVIEHYDASTHMLSLATPSETTQFAIGPSVRVRQGRRSIEISQLVELVGYRASVRYLDEGGARTVESVHISGSGPKPGRNSK